MDRDKLIDEVKELLKDAGVSSRKAPNLSKKLVKMFEENIRQDANNSTLDKKNYIHKIEKKKDFPSHKGIVSSATLPNTDKIPKK